MSAAGTIVIINGASSAGKTSLLRALQAALPGMWLEAGLDKFIWMLPERYLERPLWDGVLGLADRAGADGHRLVAGMHQAIAALSRAGCSVLADHVLVEPGWARQSAELFAPLPAYLVGLRCPLAVLEERERSRGNRTLGQARLQHERVHAFVRYDLELDSSQFSVHECATQVMKFLESGARPEAFSSMLDLHTEMEIEGKG